MFSSTKMPRFCSSFFTNLRSSIFSGTMSRRSLTTSPESVLKRTRNPAEIKILPQRDIELFQSFFPRIVEELTTENMITSVSDVNERIKEIMNHNVNGGKQLRPGMLIAVYKFLESENNMTEEKMCQAFVLGWCVEMMASFALILDDIVDNSETRRGKICWFKKENVGLNAINDGILIQMSIFRLLKKYFWLHKYYKQIVDVFLEVNLKTFVGQTMDSCSSSTQNYTRERYHDISDNKTGYYTFYFPIVLASLLAGRPDLDLQRNAFEIFMELGRFYQYQNDYMDCYGESYSGKIGTDIQEGKCSWLIISALEKASESQRKVLEQYYGKWDEHSVNSIKDIYSELNLKNSFDIEVDEYHNRITAHLLKMKNSLSEKLLTELTQVFLGYQEYLE